MNSNGTKLVKAALSAAHFLGADGLLAPFTRGAGVIFMLHHVAPQPPRAFEPNRILKVTPAFLECVIERVKLAGFETIALDEIPKRLADRSERPFACFTLDDGYRDNETYAYPVFKRHNVPFTIYVPTDYADGNGDLWWLTLEAVIRLAPEITIQMDGLVRVLPATTTSQKYMAYETIYWWLRRLPEARARLVVAELAASIGYDPTQLCRDLVMDFDTLRSLASDPLVTIGAHTRRHLALAKLPQDEMEAEISQSVARIEAELARPCRHFSYPYGCQASAGRREFAAAHKLGMTTAVTTRKGLIAHHHQSALTALPRLSLNGDFQDARYVKVLLSGAPFAVMNALGAGR
jgi:peptidoglycan/xylan/chitin deacetylase (PgdA/CDA1 family)